MTAIAIPRQTTRTSVWTGRALSGIAIAFMTFDAALHIAKPAVVSQAFAQLGVPDHLSVPIGVIALFCVALFAVPRTAVFGALLLTAYLGGATAIQLRAGAAAFPILFPTIVAVLVWSGLVLRRADVRAMFTTF